MANLLGFFCLVIGIYYSNGNPLPASALVEYPKQKEIKPESELRFGYGMSFQYHGQMLHGLNRYNLLVGLEIPDLRIPEYYTPGQDMYNSQFCEGNNNPKTQVWYKTCTNIWPAVQTAIRKVHDLRYDIKQIYQEELPAIIPNYKIGPMKKPQELNTSPVVSRKKRFITDIIGLGIQAFSAISQHRKQNKLEKSMKHLKHRQNVLDHKIEALEDDMISITKETFEELDYLRRELELTGYNIKVLTTKIKRVEYELSLQAERVIDNSNSILFLSGTISVLLSEMERYLALHERVKSELDHVLDALDNLSNNLLSHSVIRPSVLKKVIEHVKQQLAEKYSNYELVITEVHDYYNIPVSSFDYSVYDNPEGIVAKGEFQNGDLILYRGWVFDFLTIQWDNISLSQYDLDLWLPSSLPVSLTSKFFLRKLFDSPNTLFRIIAYNPQNGKVRPITSTYKLYQPMMSTCQYFQEEEVVSSDARNADLETTPSAPNGEVISEEHSSRIICTVHHDEYVPDLISDDEIPDLVSNPDLANDDKEAQELKADQDFDRDTEVAIQQSLDLCTGYGQPRGDHNSKTDK